MHLIFSNWVLKARLREPPSAPPISDEELPDDELAEALVCYHEEEIVEISEGVGNCGALGHTCIDDSLRTRLRVVGGHAALADALVSAIHDNWSHWWSAREKIGPELFLIVRADVRVRHHMPRSLDWLSCQAYVRHYVCTNSGIGSVTRSFLLDTGVAAETVESLMATALSEGAPVLHRHLCIRILLRFFQHRLLEHFNDIRLFYRGHQAPRFF